MGAYVVGVVVALAAAGFVIVLANRGSDERTSWRTFVADFKAGWRGRKDREPEPEPVDVPLEELFAAEAEPGDPYVHLDEFADLIERTGDRAGQLWHHEREVIQEHLPHPKTEGPAARPARSAEPRAVQARTTEPRTTQPRSIPPRTTEPRAPRRAPGRTSGRTVSHPDPDSSEGGSVRRTSVSGPR